MSSRLYDRRNQSFTVILFTVALMVAAVFSLPHLSIQYGQEKNSDGIEVTFQWSGGSARNLESEVTSPMEAMLSRLSGLERIVSESSDGKGRIMLYFPRGTDMAAVRLEISSAVRSIFGTLPRGVTYPEISVAETGNVEGTSFEFMLLSEKPMVDLSEYAEREVVPRMKGIEGVKSTVLKGNTHRETVVIFYPEKLVDFGISFSELEQSLKSFFSDEVIGLKVSYEGVGEPEYHTIRLKGHICDEDWKHMPIRSSSGRIVRLSDVAYFSEDECFDGARYRVNGMNAVCVSMVIDKESNLLQVCQAIYHRLGEMEDFLKQEVSIMVSYDASLHIKALMKKMFVRTLLSLVVLLAFIYLVNRKLSSLLVIFSSLAVNVLLSLLICSVLGIEINIYSLAALSVSLGMLLDTGIMMSHHYALTGSKMISRAIAVSLMAVVGTLLLWMVLVGDDFRLWVDFTSVLSVSLVVSFLVAYFFVPALMDMLRRLGWNDFRTRTIVNRRRWMYFSSGYCQYIRWGRRYRWCFVLIFLWGLGIPFFLLPETWQKKDVEKGQECCCIGLFRNGYNNITHSRWIQKNRHWLLRLAGTSSYAFYEAVRYRPTFRTANDNRLYISVNLPENVIGSSLDYIVSRIETFLLGHDGIYLLRTELSSSYRAEFQVLFTEEARRGGFPLFLKKELMDLSYRLGSAGITITGVDGNVFSTAAPVAGFPYAVNIYGYDYNRLQKLSVVLMDSLNQIPRVRGVSVADGRNSHGKDRFRWISESNIYGGSKLRSQFGILSMYLFDAPVPGSDENRLFRLRSYAEKSFDSWNFQNAALYSQEYYRKMSASGLLVPDSMGSLIKRENQSYVIKVGFSYNGPIASGLRITESIAAWLDGISPLGFRAEAEGAGIYTHSAGRYLGSVLVVCLFLFFLGAILTNSVSRPLAILSMVPFSFIGVFTVFGITDWPFDQGGYAGLVLLSGLVVSATLYMVTAQDSCMSKTKRSGLQCYLKAFQQNIFPVLCSVLSTVLGLLPFLWGGRNEVFWFPFTVTVIVGLTFAFIGLLFIFPIFLTEGKRKG